MIRFLLNMGRAKIKTRFLSIVNVSAIALVIAAVLFAGSPVKAQSNGLGVTPKESFTMKAGQQASNSLFLSNLNKVVPLNVQIKVVDFTALDESGAAKLLQASDQAQTPWSLKPYLTVPDFVTVAPGASKQVPFTIKLPDNVGAGTYYSAIEYVASSGNDKQQVTISASTATLLFINVPGNVSELLSMKSFGMYDPKSSKFQSFFRSQPEFFSYRITNSGNVAESPAGSVVIKNMFGKTVANVSNANPKGQLALIGQTRRFQGCNIKSTQPDELAKDSNCKPFNLSPGYYSATLVVLYGQNGQPTRQIGATSHFWYLPISFLIKVIVGLLVLGYVLHRLQGWYVRRR
jgi:hypothetical protein